jgi:hypothetical protein
MSTNPRNQIQATTITSGELAKLLQPSAGTLLRILLVAFFCLAGWMTIQDTPGLIGFAAILGGALLPMLVWLRHPRPGIPITALMAVQTIFVYGLPIVLKNKALVTYSAGEINRAGLEIGLFGAAMAGGWLLSYHPPRKRARHFYGIGLTLRDGTARLAKWSLILLGLGFGFTFANSAGLLISLFETLPQGSYSLVRAIAEAATVGGTLLGAYCYASDLFKGGQRLAFWLMFWFTFVLQIAGFLLSGAIGITSAVLVGLYFGRRNVPWLLFIVIFAIFSFFNLSKFEMRAKYWDETGEYNPKSLSDIPPVFAEWADTSIAIMTGEQRDDGFDLQKQRLSDRINNLSILLYVQAEITQGGAHPLNGETYSLIPKLLIPRILWPDKPRSHEGQVLLNVHFGRQTVEQTLVTYIAWGLLAEAYGNFGPIWGALLCGLALGLALGWVEAAVRPYPLASLQAFLILILAVQTVTSFEMVASVWVTSMFQALISIIIGLSPFLHRESLQEESSPP